MAEPRAAEGGQSASLFILSFRHRDELALAVDRAGWRAIAARRVAGAERRFILSGAELAIVDARGSFEDGLGAIRALADPVEANAAGLLALISRGDVDRLGEVFAAGATHYLASPFGESELAHALNFAARHAERLGGGPWNRAALRAAESLSWQCEEQKLALSPALCERLGLAERTLSYRDAYRLLDRGGRRAVRQARARLKTGVNSTAVTHRMPDGARVVQHLSVRDGRLGGLVELLEPGETPAPGAHRDPLTGLHDGAAARRWLSDRLRRGELPGVLLVGLTRLDMLNSAYGRAAGDALLQAASRRIARVPGEFGSGRGFVARLAGTEFMVASPDGSPEHLRLLAEALVAALERRFVAGPDMVSLGAGIGAVAATADDTAQSLLRRASAALAEAREGAGGPIFLLDAASASAASQAQLLAGQLRQAMAGGEIEIVFQPQVSIATGAIVGVEALARWRHPALGSLGADTLFSAAARADHLVALSEHIQEQALRQAAAWPAPLGRLRLSLNVVAEEMRRAHFAEALLGRIDASGFPRERLTVEITESGLIEDLGAAAALLSTLRAGGCRIAIDDFGTGYSSLAYLKALPLDYIKIDKGLTQDIAGSARDRVVVRGVIEMGRSLGLDVIAEGVETDAHLAALAAEGCTLYQGYLCSEPVASARLAELAIV